jgi:hypothetical protein
MPSLVHIAVVIIPAANFEFLPPVPTVTTSNLVNQVHIFGNYGYDLVKRDQI